MPEHPNDRALVAIADLVERLRAAETERDMLRELNDSLAARNAVLEDSAYREDLRRAYRAGYLTGRASQRRGAPGNPTPEAAARRSLGRLIR